MNEDFAKIDRRSFLKLTGLTTSGLVLGLNLNSCNKSDVAEGEFKPNLFIEIPSKGKIKVICHRSEMGQGIRTSLSQMFADELDVPLDQLEIIQATGDKKYGDQNTDGSKSIRLNWTRLREMSSVAKLSMVEAAAASWGVSASSCYALDGSVFHRKSKKNKTYQSLAVSASKLKKEIKPALKDPKDFKYIGKGITGLDVPDYITGKAEFGMDVDIPGMVNVSLVRSPIPGGRIKNVKSTEALKVPGVTQTIFLEAMSIDINTNNSVGVVANNTWAAFQGCEKLQIEWDNSFVSKMSDQEMRTALDRELKKTKPGKVYREDGTKKKSGVADRYEAEFYTPFLVHAPMEPLVATAHFKGESCEVWAPTQHPQRARAAISKQMNIPIEKITINVTFLGGGFGRKSQPDFILEAVAASAQLKKPVKLTWTREDEVKHGCYHPSALQKISIDLDKNNRPLNWLHKSVFPSIMGLFMPKVPSPGDWEMNLGATTLPYNFSHIKVEGSHIDVPVRRGWLRAVNNIYHSFAVNTVIDELAQKSGRDPIDYSLDLIGIGRKVGEQDTGRLRKVIEQVRKISDYDQKKKEGRLLGFAHHYSFRSYLAFIVELEKVDDEWPRVKDVYGVLDCGHFINENIVKAQMEGSVAFGMSIAYYGNITLDSGAIAQGNFDDYEVLRIGEMPKVTVDIIKNNLPPEGVGEPAVPAFIPALTNAMARATKKKMRKLPLKAEG